VTIYDSTGLTYAATRRADPRISTVIERALTGMLSVANIGAGTGSYEPRQTVIAVEPSHVMIRQRPIGSAKAVCATAEQLPIRSNAVDAALAVLTVHHWTDVARGIAEMRRVARHRITILTWDHTVFREFWLVRDYLPAAAATDRRLAVPLDRLTDLLDSPVVQPVPVPHDCVDGFGGAFWRRPQAYLNMTVRRSMSMLALTPENDLRPGLSALRRDLSTGRWTTCNKHLLNLESLDLGYRLITSRA
jgi:SAM-dependent methyltransferase